MKPRTLLVSKVDHLDHKRRAVHLRIQIFNLRDSDKDAQRTVVTASLRDRIEMAPKQQGRSGRVRTLPATNEIANRVPADGHSGGSHPARNLVLGKAQLPGSVGPGQAIWILAERGQTVAPRHHPRRRSWNINFHGMSCMTRPTPARGCDSGHWDRSG